MKAAAALNVNRSAVGRAIQRYSGSPAAGTGLHLLKEENLAAPKVASSFTLSKSRLKPFSLAAGMTAQLRNDSAAFGRSGANGFGLTTGGRLRRNSVAQST